MAVRTLRAGSVLLIDKSPLPRVKSCAGILKSTVLEFLNPFSPPETIFSEPRVLNVRGFDWDAGIELTAPFFFYNADRGAFDAWLLSLAREAPDAQPVEVRDRTKLVDVQPCDDSRRLRLRLVSEGRSEIVETDYLVGADGPASTVRRLLGLPRVPLCATYQSWIRPGNETRIGDFVGIVGTGIFYYNWLVPKNGLLGIGGAYPTDQKDSRERFLAFKLKLTERMGIGGEDSGGIEGHMLTRLGSRRDITLGSPSRPNVLLVGEAASLLDPTVGEGISYAIKSGFLAARAIDQAPGRPLALYERFTLKLRLSLAWELLQHRVYQRAWLRPLTYRLYPQVRVVARFEPASW